MQTLSAHILGTIEDFRRQGQKMFDPDIGAECSVLTFFSDSTHTQTTEVCIPNIDFHQPAVLFERKYGLTGISQQYTLPDGVSAADLQTYMILLYHREDMTLEEKNIHSRELYNELVTLNPSLQNIQVDLQNFEQTNYLICGIASAFNVKDIQQFLEDTAANDAGLGPAPNIKMSQHPSFDSLSAIFNKHAPPHQPLMRALGWTASPETLQLIEQKFLEKKPPSPAPAEKPAPYQP